MSSCRCSIVKMNLTFGVLQLRRISTNVRVRFAPSPTGSLHVGGLRTALYNYLFAKSENGTFVLRIEDTNQQLVNPGAITQFEDILKWCHLIPDESPIVGGEFGPYIQSERLDLYKLYANKLLDTGHAYKCFCSPERLVSIKNAQTHNGYDNLCRNLSIRETNENINKKTPYCIRFKLAPDTHTYEDFVFGQRSMAVLLSAGDPIILKTNGYPTYYLASVVDDHLMSISHVFRGDDWMSSIAILISLYRAFDWNMPIFGHLPQLLTPSKRKLSKRDGAMPLEEYRKMQYSSLSVLNFATYSGGGFQNAERETLLTLDEMIKQFNPKTLSTNSAILDLEKLLYFSRLHLKHRFTNNNQDIIRELRTLVLTNFPRAHCDDNYLCKVIEWALDRIYRLCELTTEDYKFLWVDEPALHSDNINYPNNSVEFLGKFLKECEEIESDQFVDEALKKVSTLKELFCMKTPVTMGIMRLALTGRKVGPPLRELFELLGKKRTSDKIEKCIELIKNKNR